MSSEDGMGLAGVRTAYPDTGSMWVPKSCPEARQRSRGEGRSAMTESRLVMMENLSQNQIARSDEGTTKETSRKRTKRFEIEKTCSNKELRPGREQHMRKQKAKVKSATKTPLSPCVCQPY